MSASQARLMMLAVVSSAALAGFLSSVVLLWMGLQNMPIRYAVACVSGYVVFLTLMHRWFRHHSRRSVVEDLGDAVSNSIDLPGEVLRGGVRSAQKTAEGLFRGGRSGGGGASASFDAVGSAPPPAPVPLMMGTPMEVGSSKGFSLDFDDADGVLPVLAVIAIVAGVIACGSVIWSAPQMLAELVADGAIASAAYQGMKASGTDWTFGIIRRTWLPATVILVTFVLLGVAGHSYKPGADSIGDFFR